jgi:hypothetical protein
MKKLILIIFLPSCSFQINSDGSKSGSIDAQGLVKVIKAVK